MTRTNENSFVGSRHILMYDRVKGVYTAANEDDHRRSVVTQKFSCVH